MSKTTFLAIFAIAKKVVAVITLACAVIGVVTPKPFLVVALVFGVADINMDIIKLIMADENVPPRQ